MANKNEWVGLTTNMSIIQGKVIEDPQFVQDATGTEIAWMNVKTFTREPDETGTWVEKETIVPIGVEIPNRVAAIKKYVKAGRQIQVFGQFKTWTFGNQPFSGILGKQVEFGDKPFEAQNNEETSKFPPFSGVHGNT